MLYSHYLIYIHHANLFTSCSNLKHGYGWPPAGIEGVFEYNIDLFEEATIARMAKHWSILLQRIVADPSQRIWEYSLLSKREQQQLLVEWNATQTAYPREATIHELFEAQVEQAPDTLAVVYADQFLTYRELNTRANLLAHYLHQLGVGPEVLVGLCMQRSLDMIVGLLGILKAGGAYVSLDSTSPSERLAFMLTDAQVSVLITEQSLVANLPEYNVHIICLDADWKTIAQMNSELTAERFIPNPFSCQSGARLYRTGDLARYRNNGTIEFLGRLDQQVKIRGFRIELGEIEMLLGQHPAIREVTVLVREASAGDKRLVAYVVLRPERPASGNLDLRHYLQTHLPDYMIPSDFVVLETLPLTANGKIDRHALPTPNQSRPTLEQAYIAPRDNWELQMACLWETILGKHPIGIRDDFFALGGHSFLAVALMAQVQTHFSQSLPLAALFQEATVEHLARLLREPATKKGDVLAGTATHAETWSPLVPIQPHGSQRPFFCVHGADGTVLGYRKLAQYLGPEQPFYGLQARGVDDAQEPFTDIASMASFYLQAVRTLQPEGPYLLGGWSMGGTGCL